MKPSRKEIEALDDFLIHHDLARFTREIGKNNRGSGAIRLARILPEYIKHRGE